MPRGTPVLMPPGDPALLLSSSVIIVNYNGRQHLERCLPALLQAEQPGQYIVVDNASTDDSVEYVRQSLPHAQVVCNSVNVGFADAANQGASQADGQYLVFLNPDTVVERGWLEALVGGLVANREAGLTTSQILLLDDPGRINTCGNDIHVSGLTLCRGLGQERSTLAQAHDVSAVSGAAFAIPRDLFVSLGGFDESFFMYMEDTDLSWRARLAGHRCLCIPASTVLHDYRLRFGADKVFYQERNRYLMWLKALRWRSCLVLLPALLLAEVVTWGFVLLRDRAHWTNKLHAYAWVATHWAEIMASRRRTQALRQVRDHDLLRQCTYQLDYGQAAPGWAARLAKWAFDPLFFVLQKLALGVMAW